MDIVNNWAILQLFFVLQWLFRGSYCADNYCRANTPVVKICQESSLTEANIAFINSGGAPKFQRIIGCECLITPVHQGPITLTINLFSTAQTSNFKFTINDGNLLGSSRFSGNKVLLNYSKYDTTSNEGACVKIEADSEKDKFNVKCEAQQKQTDAKGTSTLSTDNDPNDEINVTLIASVVGGVVIVAFAVVAVFIIWRRRRNRNDRDNPRSQRNSKETKEYEDTMDDYGMKPNPSYEQYESGNKSGTDHLFEDQYAVPDAQQITDRYQPTGYEYISCNPLSGSSAVSNQSEPSLTENTYDHTATTSAGRNNVTENEYNHLPPSVNQNAEIDNYNTFNDIKTDTDKTQTESEYNVLKHT